MVREQFSGGTTEDNKRRFLRFQLTALLATTIDFLVTIFLKEQTPVHYSTAVAFVATCGSITAFTINRYLVFRSLGKHPAEQAFRYILVAVGSILLNTGGTYLLTEALHLPYLVSKAITSIIIGFTYSYYFSKRFVFYA
jgi:putative flippase GtrA